MALPCMSRGPWSCQRPQGQVDPQVHQERGGDTRWCQEEEGGAEQRPGHHGERAEPPSSSVHCKTCTEEKGHMLFRKLDKSQL